MRTGDLQLVVEAEAGLVAPQGSFARPDAYNDAPAFTLGFQYRRSEQFDAFGPRASFGYGWDRGEPATYQVSGGLGLPIGDVDAAFAIGIAPHLNFTLGYAPEGATVRVGLTLAGHLDIWFTHPVEFLPMLLLTLGWF